MTARKSGLAKELSFQSALIFFLTISRSVLAYTVPALILAVWGMETVGRFAYFEAMLMLLLPIVALGFNEGLAKFIASADYGRDQVRTRSLLFPALMASTLVAGIAWAGCMSLATQTELLGIELSVVYEFGVFMAALLPMTVIYLLKGSFQGVRNPALGVLIGDSGLWLLFACILVIGWAVDASSEVVFYGFLLNAIGVACVLLAVFGRRHVAKSKTVILRDMRAERRSFVRFSLTMVWISATAALHSRVDRFVVGLFENSEVVGYYFFAAMLASIVAFVQRSVNGVLAPVFANMAAANEVPSLRRLYEIATRLNVLVLVIPAAVACAGAAEIAHWLSPSVPADTVTAFQLLLAAQVVGAAVGPTNYLLRMAGYERLLLTVSVVWSVIGIALVFLMTWLGGALGTAAGMLCFIAGYKLTLFHFVRRVLRVRIANELIWWNAVVAGMMGGVTLIAPGAGLMVVGTMAVAVVVGFSIIITLLIYKDTPESAYARRGLRRLRAIAGA